MPVLRVDLRALANEEPQHLRVPSQRRQMQRSALVAHRLAVDLSAVLQQELGPHEVRDLHRSVQRRAEVAVCGVDELEEGFPLLPVHRERRGEAVHTGWQGCTRWEGMGCIL